MDVRHRELSLAVIAGGAAAGIAARLLTGCGTLLELLCGCIPGGCLLLLSWLSREAIGFGDSAVILSIGFYLGLLPTVLLTAAAFLLSGLLGVFLLIFNKKKRADELPFVPFLLAGYVLLLGVGI